MVALELEVVLHRAFDAFASPDVVYEGLSGSARSGAVGEAER